MTSGANRIRVVVVDDHPVFREGVARGLLLSGHVDVVAEAENGRQALDAVRRERPDVAVVDYRLPDLDGVAVARAVSGERLPTRVLLLSATTDSSVVFRAIEEGAAGYLPKDARRAEIVDAVLKVSKGAVVIPPGLAGGLASEIRMRSARSAPVLSERERQVLGAFARGLSIPRTAEELFLGPSTVKTYAQRLYEKLDVSDRAAAVAEALRRGLID
ncbi:response regulator [Streptomyces sp. NPDC015131]|uniref:response regulator transcription factor n=1 Tax=Streptomyces sp. NPDC015131 TaxID=3364941 RepID=UPI0036FFB88C